MDSTWSHLPQRILLKEPLVLLRVDTPPPSTSLPRSTVSGSEFTSMKLIEKFEYTSSNTALFRFQIVSKDSSETIPVVQIPATNHLTLRTTVNGKEILRSCTPISTDHDHANGYVDFLISKSNPIPYSFSPHISKLQSGSEIDVLPNPYGNFYSTKQPEILLVAIGSGITPIDSLMQKLLMDPGFEMKIKLVFFAKGGNEKVSDEADGSSLIDTAIQDSASGNTDRFTAC
ncbi:NADH-cytochrome b5 reductase [Nowakowskiella sp. JEL0407]|nr:NADH-cytochrome b5 reductase [Nowakowskiella sp. JEL0407]